MGYIEPVPQRLRFGGTPMLMDDARLRITHDLCAAAWQGWGGAGCALWPGALLLAGRRAAAGRGRLSRS